MAVLFHFLLFPLSSLLSPSAITFCRNLGHWTGLPLGSLIIIPQKFTEFSLFSTLRRPTRDITTRARELSLLTFLLSLSLKKSGRTFPSFSCTNLKLFSSLVQRVNPDSLPLPWASWCVDLRFPVRNYS